ncbi:MAG: sigma-70 family RNA polymerase sigma factor [Myxococcota bacterium]
MSQPVIPTPPREELIRQYRPYVRNIVSKIMKSMSPDVEFDDLVSYGELGLIEAADRFDPKFNVNFMTFAYYRIRGAIYDGLRGMGWLSRSQYARARYEERANNYLSSVHDRFRQSQEQRSLRDDVDQVANTISGLASIFITSLDASEHIQIEDESKDRNPHLKAEQEQMRRILVEALQKLPDQERQLLECYYYKDMTLEETGQLLGLSKSWASRLHARAIQKLQKWVKELEPHTGSSTPSFAADAEVPELDPPPTRT